MKVAIVGSRRYENKRKIKEFIFKLKQEHGEKTIIVSGGCKTGADKYAKKYALELGLQYEEYPPFHEVHNLYCTMPSSRYGKPYNIRNFHARNKIIAGTSDFIVFLYLYIFIYVNTMERYYEKYKINICKNIREFV